MNSATVPLGALSFGLCAGCLFAQGPVLSTPGTATWETVTTPGGTRTVFTITEDTVFDWNQLQLDSGSELVFDFVGGESVTNNLGGTTINYINGAVTSNGSVSFFSPDANLLVGGTITANSVTLSTLNVDPIGSSSGAGLQLLSTGAPVTLRIAGHITATDGHVLLASNLVSIRSGATVNAAGGVMIAGGSDVSVANSGNRRLTVNTPEGNVLNLGEIRGSRIEVAAGAEFLNRGLLGDGNAQVFVEVGVGGQITNESSGVIVADAVFEGAVVSNDDRVISPDTDVAAQAVNDGILKRPTLRRPDGRTVSNSRTVSYSAPMSATGDSSRDRASATRKVARKEPNASMLSRTSFFGLRGGSSEVKQR